MTASTATPVILVLNAGSSSIKFCVYRGREQLTRSARGQIGGLQTEPRLTLTRDDGTVSETAVDEKPLSHAAALERVLAALRREIGEAEIVGVGHRVVHGGL